MVLLSTGRPAQFSIVTLACPSLTSGSLFNNMILSRDMRGENLRKVISPRAEKRNCAVSQVNFCRELQIPCLLLCAIYCVTFAGSNKLLADAYLKKKIPALAGVSQLVGHHSMH